MSPSPFRRTVGRLLMLPIFALGAAAGDPLVSLFFDGTDDFVEVANSEDFSVATAEGTLRGLTIAAWMRPNTLTFPNTEGSGYAHWLGKGETGQQEWVFRMYSQGNTEGRENRISFYVFNRAGGLGVGSYFQDLIAAGEWIHVVGVADDERTRIYKNGLLRDSDVYWTVIQPEHGTAPLRMGTRDFRSYFQGALREVRVWSRPLTDTEVADLYFSNMVAQDGLVAEYLLNEGAGEIARDTTGAHDGTIFGATWASEED